MGWGAFAATGVPSCAEGRTGVFNGGPEPILPGDFISLYSGEVVLAKEGKARDEYVVAASVHGNVCRRAPSYDAAIGTTYLCVHPFAPAWPRTECTQLRL
jgi:hypothetical protein